MYNKEGKIKLETQAYYEPIGKTNIVFYDSDIGTADLVFNITRNQRPLEVSDENVDCFLMLKAKDGTYIVDTAHVENPKQGKVRYTLPKAFLSHPGNVKGQVWIAVHGKEDIVTEVDFNFTIKENMFVTVPAVDKLNYIRTFVDLRERIEEQEQYIEDALANGDDYVSQMDDTFESGMKALNDRSKKVIDEIKSLIDDYKKDLNDITESSLTGINDKYVESITEMNDVKNSITDITDTLVTNESLPKKIDTALEDKPYQKYSFTKENGKRTYLGTLGSEESGVNSILDLAPGLYEATIPGDAWEVDAPQSVSGSDHIAEIDVTEGDKKRKQIRVLQNLSNFEYRATVHTENVDNPNGQFKGWKRAMDAEEFEEKNSDTGWIHWETKNKATERDTDNPEQLHNHFRIIKTNGVTRGHLRVNVNNIQTQMAIGSIPKQYVPKVQNFYIRTPVSMNPAVLLLDTDGQLLVYLNTADKDRWQPSHYIVGEVTWIIDEEGVGI
ncbi:BppU family phage baseplate upper protein [Staphylococcus shinii]|uniref:phage baseplate upper protein n=1 Tax=Staphylococcus shinii TaxID=2912228 RepID=UPI003F545A8E